MADLTELQRNPLPVQDYVLLGGKRTPGVAVISGAQRINKWDQRPGYGLSGSSAVFVGNRLTEFTITVTLWLPEHHAEWRDFAKVFDESTPVTMLGSDNLVTGKVPKKLRIEHPLLTTPPLSIREVVVTEVTQWEVDEYMQWSCRIKCLEYRAPQAALGKPKNDPVPDAPKGTQPLSAEDKAFQEQVKLLEAARDSAKAQLKP